MIAFSNEFNLKVHNKSKIDSNKLLIILIVVLILFYVTLSPMSVFCADKKEIKISEQLNSSIISELDQIDFSGFNDVVLELQKNNCDLFSLENIKSKVYSIISGESAINAESVLATLFSGLIDIVLKYLPMLSIIVAIGVVSNLLNGIKGKFSDKSTENIINLVCFFAVVTIVIGLLSSFANKTQNSIKQMTTQMNIMFPIILTLMVAVGANAGAKIFQPIVAIMSTYMADFFDYFLLPIFVLSIVFAVISNISNNVKLDKFSSFLSSLFKWSIGIVFTIFFAVFSVQGITAGSFDSVSIRTTKYTIKSYIPIIGGYLSEGMDLILASSVLIKNAVGVIGILLIFSTILSPIIEIAVFSLMLKLTSAILEPLGNSKISSYLSSSSKAVTMLSVSLFAIGFMYLLSIGLVMTASNVVI